MEQNTHSFFMFFRVTFDQCVKNININPISLSSDLTPNCFIESLNSLTNNLMYYNWTFKFKILPLRFWRALYYNEKFKSYYNGVSHLKKGS